MHTNVFDSINIQSNCMPQSTMYIASSSTTVKFHEFPQGDLLYNYQPGTKVDGPIRSISWSKDGNWLTLVPYSGSAEIISIRDQLKLIHTVTDIEDPSCATFQHTTKRLVGFATKDGQVLVYDIKSKNVKKRYQKMPSCVTHLEFTAKDKYLVAGCSTGEVKLYSNVTNNVAGALKVPRSNSCSCLRTNPIKSNYVAAGSDEGVVVVWDTIVNKHKFFTESHKAPVTGVAFSPINADLVISTGSDRQFCCYDIVSHKCIASITVDNNMTAVDFSPDGTHFVMASQNGNIHVFDSRRIQEPMVSFQAHKSSIKQIRLQTIETNTSSYSITEENSNSIKDSPKSNLVDSFTPYLYLAAEPMDCEGNPPPMTDHDDSFLAALGIDNSTVESVNDYSSIRERTRWTTRTGEVEPSPVASKSTMGDAEPSPAAPHLPVFDRMNLVDAKGNQISTPNFQKALPENLRVFSTEKVLSPVVNLSPALNNSIISDIKNTVREVVKEELSGVFEALKDEVKFQAYDSVWQMRKLCINTNMMMIKEFIKLEDNVNALREESFNTTSVPNLAEENMKLKQQVMLLEQQLAKLGANQNSN